MVLEYKQVGANKSNKFRVCCRYVKLVTMVDLHANLKLWGIGHHPVCNINVCIYIYIHILFYMYTEILYTYIYLYTHADLYKIKIDKYTSKVPVSSSHGSKAQSTRSGASQGSSLQPNVDSHLRKKEEEVPILKEARGSAKSVDLNYEFPEGVDDCSGESQERPVIS